MDGAGKGQTEGPSWGEGLPYLVVFDNCEDPVALDEWRAHLNGARALVTARREQWEGLHCLPLEGLPRERSRELLAEARQGLSPDDPELNAIAKTLGDLPLALTLAAAYLREMAHRAPAQYLEALRACSVKPAFLFRLSVMAPPIGSRYQPNSCLITVDRYMPGLHQTPIHQGEPMDLRR